MSHSVTRRKKGDVSIEVITRKDGATGWRVRDEKGALVPVVRGTTFGVDRESPAYEESRRTLKKVLLKMAAKSEDRSASAKAGHKSARLSRKVKGTTTSAERISRIA